MATRRSRIVAKPHVRLQSTPTTVPPQPEGAGHGAAGASSASADAVLGPAAAAFPWVSRAVEQPDAECVQEPIADQPTHSSAAEANVASESCSGHILGKNLVLNAVSDELANEHPAETAPAAAPRIFRTLERQTGRPRKQPWSPFELKNGKRAARPSKMTMVDFIFYNPPGEPMSENDAAGSGLGNKNKRHGTATGTKGGVEEPKVPGKAAQPGVPYGASGETNVDMGSPTGRCTESTSATVVCNTGGGCTGGYPFDKQPSEERRWNAEQTARFYQALAVYGTDFTLMMAAFPKRTRFNLKNKYKREERQHRELVQRILAEPMKFDTEGLDKDFAEPNEPEHHVSLEGNHRSEASSTGETSTRVEKHESVCKEKPSEAVRNDGN